MKQITSLLGLLLFTSVVLTGSVQAHSADTFTVVIKESGLTPSSSQIAYNDSVIWHNTDSRENITHRIVFDFDGDGLFNGSDDWDSGELLSECNSTTDNSTENNSQPDCNITFLVWFNGTWGIGEYAYQDMLSDGTVLNGTVIVTEDVHVENSTSPAIGSSFGTFENNNDESVEDDDNDADDVRQMLLLLGAASGLGAAGLLVLLLMRRSGSDVVNVSDEEA
jgi:plastocyanin